MWQVHAEMSHAFKPQLSGTSNTVKFISLTVYCLRAFYKLEKTSPLLD